MLVAYILFYVLTGFGITEYQTIERLSFGLMGKAFSMRLHNNMEIPFLILIAAHVFISLIMKSKEEKA